LGAHVRPGRLRESLRPGSGQGGEGETQRWTADPEELATLVTARTRAILICNPNNPTGARLEAPVLDAVCRVAERVGARVIADEIYPGAEREADATPPAGAGGAGGATRGLPVIAATSARSSRAGCRRRTACRGCASAGSWRRRRSSTN